MLPEGLCVINPRASCMYLRVGKDMGKMGLGGALPIVRRKLVGTHENPKHRTPALQLWVRWYGQQVSENLEATYKSTKTCLNPYCTEGSVHAGTRCEASLSICSCAADGATTNPSDPAIMAKTVVNSKSYARASRLPRDRI